jgi:hypothetical protein
MVTGRLLVALIAEDFDKGNSGVIGIHVQTHQDYCIHEMYVSFA